MNRDRRYWLGCLGSLGAGAWAGGLQAQPPGSASRVTLAVNPRGQWTINGHSIRTDRWFTHDICKALGEEPRELRDNDKRFYIFTKSGLAVLSGGCSVYFMGIYWTEEDTERTTFKGVLTLMGIPLETAGPAAISLKTVEEKLFKATGLKSQPGAVEHSLVYSLPESELTLYGTEKSELAEVRFSPHPR